MPDPMLRLYDGYSHTSPQLRDSVRELQAMLRRHDRAVVIDGLFGRGTEDLVRSFQRIRGLRSDGVVGPDTWEALLDPDTPPSDRLATTFPSITRFCSRTSRPPRTTGRPSSPPPGSSVCRRRSSSRSVRANPAGAWRSISEDRPAPPTCRPVPSSGRTVRGRCRPTGAASGAA